MSSGTSRDARDAARELLAASRQGVAFTGAGVSTASGIPDFRSPGGIWSRYTPVSFQEFKADPEARRRYWLYKKESYASLALARPNAAHRTLARLEHEGRFQGVITQNIDGLHQDAGSRRVIELHGTNRRVGCLDCGASRPAEEIQERLLGGCPVPTCDACGGLMKPATVSFGQPLDPDVLREAYQLAVHADLLLVLGSSLAVFPAAEIPRAASEAGVRTVIINRDPTPLDRVAAVVLHGEVEEILPAVAS